MIIAELRDKCKKWLESVPRDVLLFSVLFLASSLSFGLGFEAGKGAGKPFPEFKEPSAAAAALYATSSTGGLYVGSKNGTKYYLPTCSGAARIAEANRIWFASAEEARSAGYSPAANCSGL